MTDFSKPQLGKPYANYELKLLPFDVTVDFWRRYGVTPEEVIFAKPGMWLAGPLPVDDLVPSPEVASAAAADLPALEVAMVATDESGDAGQQEPEYDNEECTRCGTRFDNRSYEYCWPNCPCCDKPARREQTEAAPVLEGQAQLL